MIGSRNALAICLLAGVAAATVHAADAPLVANGPEPRDGRETWRLEEIW